MKMERLRLFIAIELPETIKEGLVSYQAQLRSGRDSFVKWVDPGGIHLTLKFLGNTPASQVDYIEKAMAEVAQGVPPFSLELGGLGAFPNLRQPRVVWVGVVGDLEQLARLQGAMDQALEQLGFIKEGRAFSPHLTLGRFREGASVEECRRLGQRVAQAKAEALPGFLVESVSLVRSTLTPAGAIYTRLASVRLQGTLSTAPK